MNHDVTIEDVRGALRLTEWDIDFHLRRVHKHTMTHDPKLIGYTVTLKGDTMLTVVELAALAVVFGTHSIRIHYKPCEDHGPHDDHVHSEFSVEVGE